MKPTMYTIELWCTKCQAIHVWRASAATYVEAEHMVLDKLDADGWRSLTLASLADDR